ncbi:metalloregulator ArsR/SmtB family transcription factor [Sinomonas sp. ASV486]|uniref:ArsR/SmtB family transcription factor n=1 Tax=Sinomonas sp. ASV486 TaxID=3051170 RepID=UPI0027DC9C1A|nr:metalloregulator ArsR/SmtB family transcription factor [Sinomonas sp. ASV486]MDQ4489158.1 metalloregulator ArsR/SmtB family transcription factor [Sinomonas sp. ASV486]
MPDLLEVAAEPTRRRILQLLAAGESAVTPLSDRFAATRSAISQHLLLLAEVGLVEVRKEGRNRLYRLSAKGMARLHEQVAVFWTNELNLLVADAHALAASGPAPGPTGQTASEGQTPSEGQNLSEGQTPSEGPS